MSGGKEHVINQHHQVRVSTSIGDHVEHLLQERHTNYYKTENDDWLDSRLANISHVFKEQKWLSMKREVLKIRRLNDSWSTELIILMILAAAVIMLYALLVYFFFKGRLCKSCCRRNKQTNTHTENLLILQDCPNSKKENEKERLKKKKKRKQKKKDRSK